MAFELDTLDLCHDLTPLGEKHYMQLLIDIALAGVSGKEFFEDGHNDETEKHLQPIGQSIRHCEARALPHHKR